MSMSKFANTADYWEAQARLFATALTAVMDGVQDHDIQSETGLPQAECDQIAKVRGQALRLVGPGSEVQ